jgi:hypothetical protein
VQRTALLTLNVAASGGLGKGANLAKTGVTTGPPSAAAVVTAGGPPLPYRVLLETTPKPGGSPVPGATHAAPTGLPNVTHPPGLIPAEHVGGHAGRPDAMQAKGMQAATGTRRDIQMQDAAGGHTIERHVGKSETWLRNRLEKDPKMEDENFCSSFRNEAIANRVQGRFVKQNRTMLERWLKNNESHILKTEVVMREPVGIVVERGKSGASETRTSRVVVIRDSSAQGWHILTSFPVPE